MTVAEAALILTGLHAVTGLAVWWVTRERRDRHWRRKLAARDRAWARAFARIPKRQRRYTLEQIFGGRHGAA